jgi:glycosyltransferase involved in cell wall biosynthesis
LIDHLSDLKQQQVNKTLEAANSIDEVKSPLKILVSSFACGPNWGSEVGMGWNWVIHLAAHCKLIVITEKGFQEEIEKTVGSLQLNYQPEFHYIDIGEKGRELFWKQGTIQFYGHYTRWQKNAYKLAQKLYVEKDVDLVHQLNLTGFREPGYLWQLSNKIPVIWGPVGGFSQVPFGYILNFSLKNKVFYFIKNLIHYLQVHYHHRVRNAFKHVNFVFADSSTTKKVVKKVYHVDAVLMNETGGNFMEFYAHKQFCANKTMQLLWVGKMQGRKALPIAIEVVSKLKDKLPLKLTVVGDGPDEEKCRELVTSLGLDETITFTGKIPNTKVKEMMREKDLLFFTSLNEGTPHVVLEALSNGLPVLCHDICGHGDIVDETCGVKIPMISYQKSVELFAEKIEYLFSHQEIFTNFTEGARECVIRNSWQSKAKTMVDYYHKIVKAK